MRGTFRQRSYPRSSCRIGAAKRMKRTSTTQPTRPRSPRAKDQRRRSRSSRLKCVRACTALTNRLDFDGKAVLVAPWMAQAYGHEHFLEDLRRAEAETAEKHPASAAAAQASPEAVLGRPALAAAEGARSAKVRAQSAEGSRSMLVTKWREVSKVQSRPKDKDSAPGPKASMQDFDVCFRERLMARGLEEHLRREEDVDNWAVYRVITEPGFQSGDMWVKAYHGTYWYSLWSVLANGMLVASREPEGHQFSTPGVYCSPALTTAK